MTLEAWLGAVCLFGASLYLGLGYSLVVLQFPGALKTTRAANFPERFGDPVRRAVAIFTVLSVAMIAAGAWLSAREWDDGGRRWWIVVFTAAVVGATAFTVVAILPVNRRLYKPVADDEVFTTLLTRWVRLNVVRYLFWIVEWICVTGWFITLVSTGSWS
ncbi:DUF1772 domain-containing protein [Jatrophihabitans sp. YIM 134969]